MARQNGTEIVGTFGDVIYYKHKGIYCSRVKGKTGKQAPQAKIQSGILGKASALSAKIRSAFKPFIPVSNSRKVMYQLNNILQEWLRKGESETRSTVNSIQLLQGFSFNEDKQYSGFYVAMPVTRTDNAALTVRIPSFDSPNPIYPMPFDGQINIHAIAVSCNIADPAETMIQEVPLDITYTGIPVAEQQLYIPLQTKEGWITVVAVSINKLAAEIVGAVYN